MPLFKDDVSSIGQLECLDRNSNAFQHLWNKFGLQKSEAKIKEGVFVSMNWCLTMSSTGNWSRLNQQQWEPFMQVVQNILGNHKDAEVVDNLLEAYQLMSARILLKMHFLHSYIDFFLGEEWGKVSPRYKNVANEKKKIIWALWVFTFGSCKKRWMCGTIAKANALKIFEHTDLVLFLAKLTEICFNMFLVSPSGLSTE